MKGIDAKKIKEQLSEKKRAPVTLYLNTELYFSFKKACDPVSPSRVIEKLMADFNESLKSNKKGN